MSTQNRLLDDLARLATGAAGAARGVQQEIEALIRQQAERMLDQMNLVRRDEFDAVKAMAIKAREENEALERRIAALEAPLAAKG